MQIHCPHCQSVVAPTDPTAEELLCPSCGASFRRDPTATVKWTAPAQRKLGRFILLHEAGRGGFGTVYKAWDPELDRTVAIKVPRAAHLASPGDLDRFLREARLAAQLQHPAIVPIHEVGQHDGVPYLVCDFVEGTTLGEYLSARRPDLRQAAQLMADVADALQYAHERGVVHRDMKPSNIMLAAGAGLGSTIRNPPSATGSQASSDKKMDATIKDERSATGMSDSSSRSSLPGSGPLIPRLTDFGLAKREAGDITVTTEGEILGTPAYMSPEQARGESHIVDARSDVYSLGVILYQLLTGELPFRGAPRMLLHQVLHDDPRLLRSLNDRIPLDLQTICLKAMAKETARRYPTAAAFADDLRRFLRGDPILARPVGRAEKLWRWCRRNPALAAASAVTVAALWTAAIVSVAFAVRENRHAHELESALTISEEHRRKADYLLAASYLERGLNLGEQGESARGLLWLARGLQVAPKDAADLQHALRANLADWAGQIVPVRNIFSHPGKAALQLVGPDARTVLIVGADGVAALYDAATAKRIAELDRQQQDVLAAFSSEGRTIVTMRKADGAGKLWDVVTGRPIGAPLPPHGSVKSVALSAGGKHVVTVGADNVVRLWDTAAPKPQVEFRPHPDPISSAVFSPDGKTILTIAQLEARFWAVASGQPIGEVLRHDNGIAAATFSADSRFLLTGGWDRTAQVWSAATGRPVGSRLTHRKAVEVVALSPDGSTAFTAGDSTGRLWEVAAGTSIGAPLAHRNRILAAAFSSDGRTLLTGGMDAIARLWNAATGKPRGAPLLHSHTVQNVIFSLHGASFATECREGELRLWELKDEQTAVVSLAAPDKFHAVCLHGDATVAFTGGGRTGAGEARLWDVATGKPRGDVLPHPHAVHAVAVSADGANLLTGCDDGIVRVWDAAASRLLGPTMQHAQTVRGVGFSPDGKTIVSAGTDGVIQRWELATRQPVGAAWKHSSQILALAPSPDGQFILTGGSDSAARVWPISEKAQRMAFQHQDWVIAVAVSPDSKIALTGSDDATARRWDLATGKPRGLPLVHQDAVAAVAFSRDGAAAATGSEDKTARRWDLATGMAIGPPLLHSDIVLAVAFRADGQALVTVCADKSVRVWKLPAPAAGTPDQIGLWAEVMTAQELEAAGATRLLEPAEWQERRQRLQALDASAP